MVITVKFEAYPLLSVSPDSMQCTDWNLPRLDQKIKAVHCNAHDSFCNHRFFCHSVHVFQSL